MNGNNSKMFTLIAFLIGYALLDILDSREQNSIGNFFILIGQTLCTNATGNFNSNNNPENVREDDIDILARTQNVFNREINKFK